MDKNLSYKPEHEIILSEPWVKLHNSKDIEKWEKEDEICWNQTHRQRAKYEFYINAFDFLTTNNVKGDYFEFGCHRGRTFRMALTEARHHNLTDMQFLAFDSFSGLPGNLGDHGIGNQWVGGKLVTSEDNFLEIMKEHGLFCNQIQTFPGFYDHSLNDELVKNMKISQHLAMLVCIDCDLYESAVPVFQIIEPFLQEGSIIYIDDYWSGYKGNPERGVSKSFFEHQERSIWKFAEYLPVGYGGKSFITYK